MSNKVRKAILAESSHELNHEERIMDAKQISKAEMTVYMCIQGANEMRQSWKKREREL